MAQSDARESLQPRGGWCRHRGLGLGGGGRRTRSKGCDCGTRLHGWRLPQLRMRAFQSAHPIDARTCASARRGGAGGGGTVGAYRFLYRDGKDAADRLRDLGVDVFIGEGRFTARDEVEVDGQSLRFRRAVIATGARAALLPIAGLKEANGLTNETIFSLTELPRRLAVIGAGPIGCELAQVMARFGSEVTLLEVESQILIREDRDAAERVERALGRDGLTITTGARILAVEKRGGEKVLRFEVGGIEREIRVDEILLGVAAHPQSQDWDWR